MSESRLCRIRQQQPLSFEDDEVRKWLSDSDREKCRALLTQMLLEVIRLTSGQEHADD